jgi:hypothetical protein
MHVRETRPRKVQRKFMTHKSGKNAGALIPEKFHRVRLRHVPLEVRLLMMENYRERLCGVGLVIERSVVAM